MTYREALSLRTVYAEIAKVSPLRDTTSDGWIGDAAHATRNSDHNPWVKDANGVGVVRARDFDHDPDGDTRAEIFDGRRFAEHVAGLLGKHPALGSGAYVIFQGRIISTDRLGEGWRPYTGTNAHMAHVHVSVGLRGYDDTTPWGWPRRSDTKEDPMAQYADDLARIEQKVDKIISKQEGSRKREVATNALLRKIRKQTKDAATIAEIDALLGAADET